MIDGEDAKTFQELFQGCTALFEGKSMNVVSAVIGALAADALQRVKPERREAYLQALMEAIRSGAKVLDAAEVPQDRLQ